MKKRLSMTLGMALARLEGFDLVVKAKMGMGEL